MINDTAMQNHSQFVCRRIDALIEDISYMQHCLNASTDQSPLPLGMLGKIMLSELQQESFTLAEQSEQLTTDLDNAFAKARASVKLRKKAMSLTTITSIIAQLPAANGNTQALAWQLSQRVKEHCRKIGKTLDTATAGAAIVSSPIKKFA